MSSVKAHETTLLPEGAQAFINGKWTPAASHATFDVHNPFSGDLLYRTANCHVVDAEKAVKSAREAQMRWALEMTARQRSAILTRWYHIMNEREQELAQLLTLEQGKPLAESRGEIQYAASFFDWYAGEARRIFGQIVPAPTLNRTHLHTREPIGVVVLITPWNFPAAMITRKAGAALAAGCSLVVKPAEDTPLSALALAQTAHEAGVPDGVFNVIPADRTNTAVISKYLCETRDVDAISFTGSTAIGKILLTQCASTVKRVCLELGGNAPFIVFPSANIQRAVKAAMASKFRASGQACVAANRFFIHHSVHDEFVKQLTAAMKASLTIGDGLANGVTQGPLINQRAVTKIETLLEDARRKGAKILTGGSARKGTTLFEPTLLTDIKQDMQIAHEEIFGPIISISTFDTEDEALQLANSTRSGLAGYIFTSDPAQISRVSRRLHVGMVGVNEGMISCAEAAFGGVKESGLGREGGVQGIDEFTQWKYVCIAD